MRRPSAWLLDEPLAHLDPVERFELRHRLVEEIKTSGVPALYVTHDPAEALAVGDRVAVLRNGRLVQVGTPRELYDRPVNAFVATFVTSQPVGLLPARVVPSGFQVGDRILPLWAGLPPELAGDVDRRVVLALRAEDVADAARVDDPDVARLRGIVVATEFTGPSVMAAVELDAPPVTGPGLESLVASANRARLTVRLPRDHTVQLGSPLTLAVDAARAHVFDAETGEALSHGRRRASSTGISTAYPRPRRIRPLLQLSATQAARAASPPSFGSPCTGPSSGRAGSVRAGGRRRCPGIPQARRTATARWTRQLSTGRAPFPQRSPARP